MVVAWLHDDDVHSRRSIGGAGLGRRIKKANLVILLQGIGPDELGLRTRSTRMLPS